MPYPSKNTPQIREEILSRLRRGEPLACILRDGEAMPSATCWGEWCKADESLGLAYARAREEGEDVIAAECLDIMDEKPERFVTEHGTRVDPAFVQHQRNRFEGRLKLLKVWNPKRWGDKVDLNHAGSLTVTIASDVSEVG